MTPKDERRAVIREMHKTGYRLTGEYFNGPERILEYSSTVGNRLPLIEVRILAEVEKE